MKAEDAPAPMYFSCPRKGHVQVEEFSYQIRNNETEQIVLDTGPLCRQCWIEDQTERFETRRIAPPSPKRKRTRKPRADAKPS